MFVLKESKPGVYLVDLSQKEKPAVCRFTSIMFVEYFRHRPTKGVAAFLKPHSEPQFAVCLERYDSGSVGRQ